MLPQIGPAEILVILLVALLVFGPHRLPEVGRQVGSAMRQLRKLQETIRGEIDEVLHGDVDTTTDVATSATGAGAPLTRELPGPQRTPPALPPPEGPEPLAAPSAGRAPSRFRAPSKPPPTT